jgi:endonuclease/exonuclease/phosphatase family metal-dependent hydrolase
MIRKHHLLTLALCASLTACASENNTVDDSNVQADAGEQDTTEQDATQQDATQQDTSTAPTTAVRVATYNASLYRQQAGQLADDLAGGQDAQAKEVAEVLQRVRPDVVLINEFDWDADGEAARIFQEEYLAVGQAGQEALDYSHRYVPATNTGLASGVDLDGDGQATTEPGSNAYGNDSYGYGQFPGQYGMVIYSRYPIATDAIRSFQEFLWKEMPDSQMPADFYSEQAKDVMRLSSKNHVDVPVEIGGTTVHVLASHPTPPAFDGPEDRNGRRNHDEVRLWLDYVTGGEQAAYLVDDSGVAGGLADGAEFVVVGDLNTDPKDGDSRRGALVDLLAFAQDPQPTSEGGAQAGEDQGRANAEHEGDHALDTADFSDGRVGNLRVDYALPSQGLSVTDSGVFWPAPGQPQAELVDVSDHHLVWVDLEL